MNVPEGYDPFPLTVLVAVNATGFEQVPSFGPYTLNRIDPVGLDPPDSVAVSEIVPPNATDDDAAVDNDGDAFDTW